MIRNIVFAVLLVLVTYGILGHDLSWVRFGKLLPAHEAQRALGGNSKVWAVDLENEAYALRTNGRSNGSKGYRVGTPNKAYMKVTLEVVTQGFYLG